MKRVTILFLLLGTVLCLSAQDFGPIIEVNQYTTGLQETDGGNSIVLFEDKVHLLWQEMDSTWSSYVTSSYDGGATFTQETRIDTSGAQVFGTLTVDDAGNLYVVYDDVDFDQGMINGVYLSKSTDSGQTFSDPVMISSEGAFPEVQVSGNHVYVSWMSMNSDTTFGFFFSRSLDGGINFETPYEITTVAVDYIKMDSPSTLSMGPDGLLYFVWNDGRRDGDGSDIYIAKSSDNGQSFGTNILVNEPTNDGLKLRTSPGIAFGAGNIYLVWREDADDSGGGRRILFAKASQTDMIFGSAQEMVTGGWASPCIATARDGEIYVGYPQQGDHTNGFFIRRSSDQGQTFSTGGLISQSGGFVKDPSIAVGPNKALHAVWTIARDDNEDDVYYVRSESETTGMDDHPQVSPETFTLHPATPNPFNPTTTISYDLPENLQVTLTVYDVTGREVVTLHDTKQPAGHYEVMWNGTDHLGNQLSTGVYFARLQAGALSKTIKMVYLK